MDDALKKAATSILLEELMEDDESVIKSVSGVVNMVNTLNAVAGAALALGEALSQEEEEQGSAQGKYTYNPLGPESPCLRRVAPEYTTSEFKSLFRMRRSTFEMLMQELQKHATLPQKRVVSQENKLLFTLCLLGNLETYRSIADRFSISKGTLHYVVTDVCHAITELHKHYIKFPTEQDLVTVSRGFSKFGFPGVVGCLGVSHIGIPGPREHREAYVNKKRKTSIQLQAIADSDLLFTDIYAGWPGSVCKTRVLRNSPVGKFHAAGNLPAEFHLLASSGYDLTISCMVPYQKCGKLTEAQENYNKIHRSAYLCIKRAFSLLKGKFRRLKSLDMRSLDAIPIVIAATCVLHNFILTVEGTDDADMDDEEGGDDKDSETDTAVEWEESARLKRDNIATSL